MNDVHPDLGGLLRGELGNGEALEVADHVRGCGACRDDLVEVSLGHGLLTAAVRRTGLPAAVPPPVPGPETAQALPASLERELRRRPRRRWAMAGAAGLLVAVTLGASLLLTRDDQAARPPAAGKSPTLQVATLEPVDGTAARAGGRVSMATDRQLVTRMRVDTVDLARAPRGEFYYVWLLDPATNKMLPLGQVTPGHRASFDLPESLVAAYSAIDVSLESDDGDPGHSVTSVLRASYAAPTASPTGGS